MSRYGTISDDFYINMTLNTEMNLPQNRDSVLHFFEQIQKKYPTMRNFYNRERDEYVLEEEKESGRYRWVGVESRRICSGQVNPDEVEHAIEQHEAVLELAPFALSASPLDCESLNIMMGFDYTYRGNHNQLLAEVLGMSPALERMAEIPGATLLGAEPVLQLALDERCRVQCRLNFEPRTTAYHVRTNEFPEEQLSVYLTVRRYGGLDADESFTTVMQQLWASCQELVDGYIVDQILLPLQQTIAIR